MIVRAWHVAVTFGIGLAGCSDIQGEFSVAFPSEAAIEQTSELVVTAFVPLRYREGDSVPDFIDGREVGVFAPTRSIDPEAIRGSATIGPTLVFRDQRPYPLEDGDWLLNLGEVDASDPSNPWGALMLYVEARGEGREPGDAYTSASVPLLAQSVCVRTTDGSHANLGLDAAVKEACVRLSQAGSVTVELAPVAPPEFELAPCDGRGALVGAKDQRLAPGAAVCLSPIRCDGLPSGEDCFVCEQSFVECDDISNVPVVFTVEQAVGDVGPRRQIAVTDRDGRAEAPIDLDGCESDVYVTAQVVGRSTPPIEFTLACVEPINAFECEADLRLGPGSTPAAVGTLPGDFAACAAGDVDACAQVVIARSDGTNSRVELWHPERPAPIVRELPDSVALAVHGFAYREATALGGLASRPMVAVATTRRGDDDARLRLSVFEVTGGALVPHDGATGELPTRCSGWLCGSTRRCDPLECQPGEVCYEGVCVEEHETSGVCPGPAGCACEVTDLGFGARVDIASGDRDGDGLADLTVVTEEGIPVLLHLTSRAEAGEAYGRECECGRYGVRSRAVAVGTFGGDAPDRQRPDLFFGGSNGAYVRYGRYLDNGRSAPQCGGSEELGLGMAIRDLASGRFGCALGDASCDVYDDVFAVGEPAIGQTGADGSGVVRVVYGSARDLHEGDRARVRAGTGLDLRPRTFEGRAAPRAPERVALGDFNADRHLDAAVLYVTSGELHVWLGASNAGLGESEVGVVVEDCAARRTDTCTPMADLAAGDFDGDGATDLAVVCNPSSDPTLRFFAPRR